MAESDYKPLLTVLLDLAMVKRGLVLMRGPDYWRIEDAAAHARREASSGHPSTRKFLTEPRFFWTIPPDKKVVIMEKKESGDVPFAVEPGSTFSISA